MLITGSQVQFSSQRQSLVSHIRRERLVVEINNPGTPARQPAPSAAARFVRDEDLSRPTPNRSIGQPPAQAAHARMMANDLANLAKNTNTSATTTRQAELDDTLSPIGETRLQALVMFVEQLTGKKMKLLDAKDLQADTTTPTTPASNPDNNAERPQRSGFSLEYDFHEEYREEEHTQFSAQAVVNTADGQQININLELHMSRIFMESQTIRIREGDAKLKDPLVLNFNGNAAALTDETFRFDLDADGEEDQISQLSHGSGFLALDKNEDGEINDGRELFGAQSGDGFADLRAYDEDGNQWIDAADSIFDKLRIWQRDSAGNEQLIALGQANVGAIYLGNINTAFDLKNQQNELQGQVVSSGIFLKENGSAGTVQQLNLVV